MSGLASQPTEDIDQARIFVNHAKGIQAKISEVRSRIAPLIENVKNGKTQTTHGVSLLEVRVHSLLSYITNLSYLSLLKLNGRSIQNHPVVDRLIELRTVLEKTKPLEQKLAYQIDKLVKAAAMDEDGEKMAYDLGDDDAMIKNPLSFKPNPSALLGASDKTDAQSKQSKDELGGVYRPPRVAPMRYDDSSHAQHGRLSQQFKDKASRSRLLGDLQTEFDDRPEEVDAEGTGYGARGATITKEDEKLREREEFEEENFIRLNLSKKDKRIERTMQTKGHLMRFQNEFQDLDADFRDLSEVHHAVEVDDLARYGEGVVGKRNKRTERFIEEQQSKRSRYSDTGDIEKVTREKRGEMGKDAFTHQKHFSNRKSKLSNKK
ncbi:hypothetical protein BDEG_24861 [Batrachochytrium dendrobatidis JEL423]|uniref:Sas10 C-terminal domain-containing protein n=2 Tax=Batrachochytrium dendrobatidis (strain JEL423) TaxID=403673 RepID=A0A177WM85_BATDL|nr:hypothetical protein O5D80_005320 [Batrachochytrium dendrobatidis]OAJ41227.1 hypothetical protein BDEG_24861 [Batrachochytrium dendrobatidis JEL423]